MDELLKALKRNAEITALSVALHGKSTCHVCGLFATRQLHNEDGYGIVWTDPSGRGCFIDPCFCDDCQADPQGGVFRSTHGSLAARRLNKLLRGE
jgi:hypothetical protein